MIVFEVRGEYIQLDQLLKATGLCSSGGLAHAEIEAGQVQVDGATETRKRAKLRPGQLIAYDGHQVKLMSS
jgi:ribosome-associated protein